MRLRPALGGDSEGSADSQESSVPHHEQNFSQPSTKGSIIRALVYRVNVRSSQFLPITSLYHDENNCQYPL